MTQLTLHDLTYRRRGDDWVVAYEPTGAYALIDETGKQLLHDLQDSSVEEAKKKYAEYDVDEFVQTIKEKGLVHKQDHHVVDHRKHITDLLDLDKKHLRWAKNKVTLGILLGIVATGIYLLLTNPQLVPTPDWFYATGWYAALLPTIVLIMFGISAAHELGHYAALKATGHTTGLQLRHRWHFLRPRTNIDNAQLLRPAAKIGVYSAGLLIDLAIMSIALIHVSNTGSPVAKLIALLAFLHALGQFTPSKDADLMRVASHHAGVRDITSHFPKALKSMCIFCEDQDDFHRHAAPLLVLSTLVLAIILGVYTPVHRHRHPAKRQGTARRRNRKRPRALHRRHVRPAPALNNRGVQHHRAATRPPAQQQELVQKPHDSPVQHQHLHRSSPDQRRTARVRKPTNNHDRPAATRHHLRSPAHQIHQPLQTPRIPRTRTRRKHRRTAHRHPRSNSSPARHQRPRRAVRNDVQRRHHGKQPHLNA